MWSKMGPEWCKPRQVRTHGTVSGFKSLRVIMCAFASIARICLNSPRETLPNMKEYALVEGSEGPGAAAQRCWVVLCFSCADADAEAWCSRGVLQQDFFPILVLCGSLFSRGVLA